MEISNVQNTGLLQFIYKHYSTLFNWLNRHIGTPKVGTAWFEEYFFKFLEVKSSYFCFCFLDVILLFLYILDFIFPLASQCIIPITE